MEQQANIPKPLPPRDECLLSGKHVLRGELAGGTVLCVYDPERMSAGTYHVEQQVWRIHVPVPLEEYLRGLVSAGIDLPGGDDLKTWLAAVSPTRGKAN